MMIPSNILIHGDYWPEATPEERAQIYEGKVIAIITDSGGEMYAAFEMPDQGGLQLISLGSNFFKGFTAEAGSTLWFDYNHKLKEDIKSKRVTIASLRTLGFNLWRGTSR